MESETTLLTQEAIAAIHRGNIIEAIKIIRAASGLGLSEAKQLVDAYLKDNPTALNLSSTAEAQRMANLQLSPEAMVAAGLPAAAIMALANGNLIEAVKIVRNERQVSLAQAKNAVDVYLQANPSLRRETRSTGAPVLTIIILLGLIGFIVYYFYGSH